MDVESDVGPKYGPRLQHVVLWLLPVLTAALALTATTYYHQDAELARARSYLVEGNVKAAADVFSAYADSSWWDRQARAGLALSRTGVGGESLAGNQNLDRPALRTLSLPLLVQREFFAGNFERCLKLARLAERINDPLAPLFLAASLVELGRRDEAESAWSEIQSRFGPELMGQRLQDSLDLISQGYTRFLRDRRGRPLGGFDEAGKFRFLPGIEPDLIPAVMIENLRHQGSYPGVRLSIDLELSKLARSALRWYRGSIVLLEPHSGEVLAAVSDRRTLRREKSAPFLQKREPASIAKVITTAAAFRQGMDANALIARMRCRSAQRYGGGILYCSFRAGKLDGLNEALAVSCNVAFANLGVQVGREALLQEFEQWGFGRTGAKSELFGRVLESGGDERQLADLSIGLTATEITPLHAALMAATVANKGVMPEPVMVTSYDGLLGLSPQNPPFVAGRPVVDPGWLPTMVQALEAVSAWGGTGAGLAPPDFPVAMKTGTASEPGSGYHTNYIGIGPMPDANIAFCVRVTHQRTSSKVRTASRVVTRRLLRGLAQSADRTAPPASPALARFQNDLSTENAE